jgi:hypothetical protein
MAAYYFQGEPIVAPFRISSNEPVFSADSITLRVRRVKQGAQRWEMEFSVMSQDPTTIFTEMVTNFHNTVTLEMPQLNVRGETISQGTASALVRVSGAHEENDSTIQLKDMGNTKTINKGRFVKFSNHDKIYLVHNTTTSATDGTGTLSIYPSLRTTVADDTQLLYRDGVDDITFTAYRDVTEMQGLSYSDGVLSDIGTINLLEAL